MKCCASKCSCRCLPSPTYAFTVPFVPTIRPATTSDLPAIMALIRRVVPLMNEAGNFQWSTDYPNEAVFQEDIGQQQLWAAELEGAAVVLNLAGRSVDCRYNAVNKYAITRSRTESTRVLGQAIAACANPPAMWLNASTATIYEHTSDQQPANTEGGELAECQRDSAWPLEDQRQQIERDRRTVPQHLFSEVHHRAGRRRDGGAEPGERTPGHHPLQRVAPVT